MRLTAACWALAVACPSRAQDAAAPPTFARDIAPIVYAQCAGCHRPGAVGPFSLTSYDDVRKHLKPIVRAVTTRAMPPWLPEPGFGDFVGQRRLDDAAIDQFRRWADAGAPEGDPAQAPKPPPAVSGDWALGPPDLVVRLPGPYTLAADGPDLYRNFVFPTGLEGPPRYVRAVELRSSNPRVVHHANLFLDRSGSSKRRSDKAGGAGYDAMDPGDDVTRPDGSDLNWRPGRDGLILSDDAPWALPADADLVLQTHLRRQGKPEELRPELGLYFTDKRPPPARDARLTLRAADLDIPAGDDRYTVESRYTLPVDASALGVFAHAHYLGKEVDGWAILPDARRVELLRITRWNFNMQDTYAYREPIPLPRGTTIHMRWVFDNSARNPVNPSTPPRRVVAGETSDDEMAELWVQLKLKDRADYDAFNADYTQAYAWPNAVAGLEARLKRAPGDARAHVDLAKLMLPAGRLADARRELDAALAADPKFADAHYLLGHLLVAGRETARALDEFRQCVDADPDNARARGDYALTLAIAGKPDDAEKQFQQAIRLNPRDPLNHINRGRVLTTRGKLADAKAAIEQGLRLDPDHPLGRAALKEVNAAMAGAPK